MYTHHGPPNARSPRPYGFAPFNPENSSDNEPLPILTQIGQGEKALVKIEAESDGETITGSNNDEEWIDNVVSDANLRYERDGEKFTAEMEQAMKNRSEAMFQGTRSYSNMYSPHGLADDAQEPRLSFDTSTRAQCGGVTDRNSNIDVYAGRRQSIYKAAHTADSFRQLPFSATTSAYNNDPRGSKITSEMALPSPDAQIVTSSTPEQQSNLGRNKQEKELFAAVQGEFMAQYHHQMNVPSAVHPQSSHKNRQNDSDAPNLSLATLLHSRPAMSVRTMSDNVPFSSRTSASLPGGVAMKSFADLNRSTKSQILEHAAKRDQLRMSQKGLSTKVENVTGRLTELSPMTSPFNDSEAATRHHPSTQVGSLSFSDIHKIKSLEPDNSSSSGQPAATSKISQGAATMTKNYVVHGRALGVHKPTLAEVQHANIEAVLDKNASKEHADTSYKYGGYSLHEASSDEENDEEGGGVYIGNVRSGWEEIADARKAEEIAKQEARLAGIEYKSDGIYEALKNGDYKTGQGIYEVMKNGGMQDSSSGPRANTLASDLARRRGSNASVKSQVSSNKSSDRSDINRGPGHNRTSFGNFEIKGTQATKKPFKKQQKSESGSHASNMTLPEGVTIKSFADLHGSAEFESTPGNQNKLRRPRRSSTASSGNGMGFYGPPRPPTGLASRPSSATSGIDDVARAAYDVGQNSGVSGNGGQALSTHHGPRKSSGASAANKPGNSGVADYASFSDLPLR